jgi:hypothetical protein
MVTTTWRYNVQKRKVHINPWSWLWHLMVPYMWMVNAIAHAYSRYWVSLGASSWLSSGVFGLGVQNFIKIGCGYAF